jgi:hypothetical protein
MIEGLCFYFTNIMQIEKYNRVDYQIFTSFKFINFSYFLSKEDLRCWKIPLQRGVGGMSIVFENSKKYNLLRFNIHQV